MKHKLAIYVHSTSKTLNMLLDRSHKTLQLIMETIVRNCRTDEVYINEEIVIITFLNARLNKYFALKI